MYHICESFSDTLSNSVKSVQSRQFTKTKIVLHLEKHCTQIAKNKSPCSIYKIKAHAQSTKTKAVLNLEKQIYYHMCMSLVEQAAKFRQMLSKPSICKNKNYVKFIKIKVVLNMQKQKPRSVCKSKSRIQFKKRKVVLNLQNKSRAQFAKIIV